MKRDQLAREASINFVAKQMSILGDTNKHRETAIEVARRHGLSSWEFTRARLKAQEMVDARFARQISGGDGPPENLTRIVLDIISLPDKGGILTDYIIGRYKIK